MTHDELLEAVNSPTYRQSRTLEHPYIALRAVVELHKPIEGHEHLCDGCCFDYGVTAYPCPTIQVIEKELG